MNDVDGTGGYESGRLIRPDYFKYAMLRMGKVDGGAQ